MDRQELDRSNPEGLDVIHDLLATKTSERAAQVFGNGRVHLGIAAYVGLVDDRAIPWDRRCTLPTPGESRVYNTGFRHETSAVALIEGHVVAAHGVAEDGVIPLQAADVRLGIGVEAQFVRVEAVAARRIIRPVDAVTIGGSGARVG